MLQVAIVAIGKAGIGVFRGAVLNHAGHAARGEHIVGFRQRHIDDGFIEAEQVVQRPHEEHRIGLAVFRIGNIVDRVANDRLGAFHAFYAKIAAHLGNVGADALNRVFIPSAEHLLEQALRISRADQAAPLGGERSQNLGIPAAIARKHLNDCHVRLDSEEGQRFHGIAPFVAAPVLIPALVVDGIGQSGVSRRLFHRSLCLGCAGPGIHFGTGSGIRLGAGACIGHCIGDRRGIRGGIGIVGACRQNQRHRTR